jgi:hypothetical protein
MTSMPLKLVPPCAQSWCKCIPKPIPLYVGSNISCLGEGFLSMGVTQHVDKGCPFRIDDNFFNNMSQLQQPLNH